MTDSTTLTTSSSPSASVRMLKLEVDVDASSIFLVTGRHLGAMLVNHVRFEVEEGIEDDELALLAR